MSALLTQVHISSLYEGKTSAPKQRLKFLMHPHAAGIHTYVAVAPVFPECGYQGMLDAFTAVKAPTLAQFSLNR